MSRTGAPDGGETWLDAKPVGPDYAGAWRLFRYEWDAGPGTHLLPSRDDRRARSATARAELEARGLARGARERRVPWNDGAFAANAYRPNGVEVTVEDAGDGRSK